MAVSPDPIGWYKRMLRRDMLKAVQPEDDPNVVAVRPYGIARGLGMTMFPQDYTLGHYGGTMRGAKIGQWRDTLMVAPDPQPVNAPTLFSWKGGDFVKRTGTNPGLLPVVYDDGDVGTSREI